MRRGPERAPHEPLERCQTGVKSVLRQTKAERGERSAVIRWCFVVSLLALGQARGVTYMYTMGKAVL